MNTIFKFYFQAWLLWGAAAAYVSAYLLRKLAGVQLALFSLVFVFVVGAGLVYPYFSLLSKTNNFAQMEWNLDSTAYLQSQAPNEMAAIQWLQEAPVGVVAEAVSSTGGSYTNYARVATLSGQPGVLGWTGHQSQWRGGAAEMGSRQADLEGMYCSRNWEEAETVLTQYGIRYVFVGGLERSTYVAGQGNCPTGLNEAKFQRFLNPVFQQGEVTIYEVPGFGRVRR